MTKINRSQRLFLRNTDIAIEYNVSKPTVTRWFELAKIGKNNLQLELVNKILRIANNEHNFLELETLAKNATRYQANSTKDTTVSPEFYDLLSYEETVELVNDLRYKSQVKDKFYYKKTEYLEDFNSKKLSPFHASIKELLPRIVDQTNHSFETDMINVIDISPVNSNWTKKLIDKISKTKEVKHYIGINSSLAMSELTKIYLDEKLPEINKEFFVADPQTDNLAIPFNQTTGLGETTPSLIMMLQGTMSNQRDHLEIFKNVSNNMKKDDLFLCTLSINSHENKNSINAINNSEELLYSYGWYLELLGIDYHECEVKLEFNENGYKEQFIVLDKDYNIKFDTKAINLTLNLRKGQKISVYQHHLFSLNKIVELTSEAGLNMQSMNIDSTGRHAVITLKRSINI